MSVALNAIVPGKRERDSISPVPLDDEEENENKGQKKDEEDDEDPLYDEEDEEDQPYGHSGLEDMSEEEGEATGDNRQNPTSNDRMDAMEEKLEKLMLGQETSKLYCEKLEHELGIFKRKYESDNEKKNVLLQRLLDSVAQLTRAINWLFGRLRTNTKLTDAAATVVKALWKYLRGEEAKPRPTRSPAVVSVASFENPDANPEYWAE
ncbi:unnamed protein product [Clonostachys rhizophaga]|uniref:Uncharacterized protein n=1 Tax=Clonostachys rhizophaga TaxID=160324 RepID=A0A9N9VN60_9HYPO|nr:unnamed protein product [Clonostachys rhizophaga]